ncbi:MAG: hypothetical protein OXQ94_05255 [Gemmatimonadota bacterium]|nr:hypothetical protein [Gemmatimonadota bacterium]MDE2871083.1 hypothetical protein [Gemmatimonadota bacterium]
MRWRTLIPLSLTLAVAVTLALTNAGGSMAQEPPPPHPLCGMVKGDDCESICQRECKDGSCCHMRHYNYL